VAINLDKSALAWTLPWDADWVTAVALVGSTRRVAAGNSLGQILLWDLPEKAGGPAPVPARRLDGHTNRITRLCATPDGRWLLSASLDHSIRYWDMQADAKGDDVVVLNARRRAELAARRNGPKPPPPVEAKVKVQPAARVLDAHKEWVTALSLTPDAKHLLSGDDGGNVLLWDRASGKELRRWKAKAWVQAAALAPDGRQAFVSERKPLVFDSGRRSGAVLWDAAAGTIQHDLGKDFKGMFFSAAAYSPDGKTLAISRGGEVDGPKGTVTLIDPTSGKKIRELTPGHLNGACDLAFHPGGAVLASCGRDTTVRLWSIPDGKLLKELGKPRGGQFKDWVCAVAFSPDGTRLAGGDQAGAVAVWTLG
jgi:WD40 repeat protein